MIIMNDQIVLVYPSLMEREYMQPTCPPYGLLAVAKPLVDEDYHVEIVDQRIDGKEKLIKVLNERPLCVGFTSLTGPALSNALKLSRLVKEKYPDVPIIWGGVHATFLPEQTVQHPLVDVVVRGEGEITFLHLVKTLESGERLSKVDGITFIKNERIFSTPERPLISNLNEYGYAWELINPKKYIAKTDMGNEISLVTSRGCPHRCAFCYNLRFYGKTLWRGWSAERALKDIEFLVSQGADYIFFEDDNFVANRRRLSEISRKLSKLDITWGTTARADYISNQFMKTIFEGGCRKLSIGAESGDQETLKLIKKDITVADIIESARHLKEWNTEAVYHWIIGFPGENDKSIYNTLKCIDKISKISPETMHMMNIFSPYPGTELYDLAVKFGFNTPKRLEEWTVNLREEADRLAYIKKPETLETIRWIILFWNYIPKRRKTFKPWLWPVIWGLKLTATIRWNRKWFSYPIEYQLMNRIRKFGG